jgi:predicted acylesterase/phospholipase RssA
MGGTRLLCLRTANVANSKAMSPFYPHASLGPAGPFTNIVFAGGGNRCFWQAGFWLTVAAPLGWRPERIAAVSAGAAIASMVFAGLTDQSLTHFKAATGRNRRNAYWGNIFRNTPVFPHAAMYRAGVLAVLDQEALARLHRGPEILVQLARFPRFLGSRVALLLGGAAYELDKKVRKALHPKLGQRLGFFSEVVSVRECATPEAFADLIIASSCTPPFTPAMRHNGRAVLDGGMVDNVPVGALNGAAGNTLVLLTRRYPSLPAVPNRLYVQPSQNALVSSWDYTNPLGIQATFDLGRRDGDAFLAAHRSPGPQ